MLPRSSTETAIHRVGTALLARHPEIARAMVARIVADVPTYRRASAATVDDVLVLATPTAELLARTFAACAPLRREDIPVLRAQAARRVHQGVSLEAFLHAYRVALAVYWEACTEEATRLRLTREAGFALARFALETMDTMSTHAAEAYLREETRVRNQTGRALRDLVEHLVGGTWAGERRRDPAAPGLDPTASLVTV
ncbi:MAG: transcriptional regulator, partial [Conexibacter sp.]|nr:transcriptional regulator [Conexibacter sp.]